MEFGDFQTPPELARRVVALLYRLGVKPDIVVEPTCGLGAFLLEAARQFPDARLIGRDINPRYVADARARLARHPGVSIEVGNFFRLDWLTLLDRYRGPLLVLGNPPWATNAALGALDSDNLPVKSNFQEFKGLDAVTGKSNFDISEWMLLRNMDWLAARQGMLAVLCKTAVARKVLAFAWKRALPLRDARLYRIDALAHFGAAVDACLFYADMRPGPAPQECAIYDSLESAGPASRFGFADGKAIADMGAYRSHYSLYGINKDHTWRSGVKHDCARVMEFDRDGGVLTNGHGEIVELEDTYLFPLVKSSDISGTRKRARTKFVLLTQTSISAETASIRAHAPKTWAYLMRHAKALDGRASVIYRNKPRFSVFGVGDYTFAPWKIAISGLYKNLNFKLFGSLEGKPTCFDDTVYFLPFRTESQARAALELLTAPEAMSFLNSMIFWDEKRPITVDVLKRLDLAKLAQAKGKSVNLGLPGYGAGKNRNPASQLPLLA